MTNLHLKMWFVKMAAILSRIQRVKKISTTYEICAWSSQCFVVIRNQWIPKSIRINSLALGLSESICGRYFHFISAIHIIYLLCLYQEMKLLHITLYLLIIQASSLSTSMETQINWKHLRSWLNPLQWLSVWRSEELVVVWDECLCLHHDDVIKWNHFSRYWPFVRGIHRSRRIPHTKASDAELWCFLWFAPEYTIE